MLDDLEVRDLEPRQVAGVDVRGDDVARCADLVGQPHRHRATPCSDLETSPARLDQRASPARERIVDLFEKVQPHILRGLPTGRRQAVVRVLSHLANLTSGAGRSNPEGCISTPVDFTRRRWLSSNSTSDDIGGRREDRHRRCRQLRLARRRTRNGVRPGPVAHHAMGPAHRADGPRRHPRPDPRRSWRGRDAACVLRLRLERPRLARASGTHRAAGRPGCLSARPQPDVRRRGRPRSRTGPALHELAPVRLPASSSPSSWMPLCALTRNPLCATPTVSRTTSSATLCPAGCHDSRRGGEQGRECVLDVRL